MVDEVPESGVKEVIPVANPGARFRACEEELQQALQRVIASGRYVLGLEVEAFEYEFAEFTGADHCVGVSSGTEAITLALLALGLKPGDEVLTVAHTAVATVAAIERAGGVAVLVDIDPRRRCMDPEALEQAVGPRCRAVVVVHAYGQAADMSGIMTVARRHGLKVVEDCAQAHGATIGGLHVGVMGDAATFSFYPTKNLAAMGDAGAVLCADSSLASKLRKLRQYGWDSRRVATERGINARLDELQAALLRVGLVSLWEDVCQRRRIAARYDEVLRGTPIQSPIVAVGTEHAMHLYVVELEGPEEFADALRGIGVATALHYPRPIHQEPAYAGRLRGAERLPHTERLYRRRLSLPMYPELTERQIAHICSALIQCVEGMK